MSQNAAYYAARAIEERRLAMASADPRARRVHLDLAAQYALKAASNVAPEPEPPEEQLSA